MLIELKAVPIILKLCQHNREEPTWYYPDGTSLKNNAGLTVSGENFYFIRNDAQVIRLHCRYHYDEYYKYFRYPLSPTGTYCCVIPTTGGEMTFCAKIGSHHISSENALNTCP